MSFLKILEKRNVPDELPSLVTEDVKKNIEETKETDKKEDSSKEIKTQELENIKKQEELSVTQPISENNESPETNIEEKTNETKKSNSNEKLKKTSSIIGNESFFIKLQENLDKEMNSLDKLEEWYNKKLLPEDTLSEMKNYYEKQNSDTIIQNLGKDFQEKLTGKIIHLQELEKKWQDIYFELIEKEGEIKEEEKELKKMLAEFIGFCKKRLKNEKTNKKRDKPKKKRKNK